MRRVDSFDAIVVAGCPPASAGAPSETMRRRVDRGVALLAAGKAPLLVLTGGARMRDRPCEAVVAAHYALQVHGVAPARLLREEASLDTAENALFTRRLLQARGVPEPRVLVVSDGFHRPRCRRLFSRHFREVEVVSAGNPGPARLLPALVREAAALGWLRFSG